MYPIHALLVTECLIWIHACALHAPQELLGMLIKEHACYLAPVLNNTTQYQKLVFVLLITVFLELTKPIAVVYLVLYSVIQDKCQTPHAVNAFQAVEGAAAAGAAPSWRPTSASGWWACCWPCSPFECCLDQHTMNRSKRTYQTHQTDEQMMSKKRAYDRDYQKGRKQMIKEIIEEIKVEMGSQCFYCDEDRPERILIRHKADPGYNVEKHCHLGALSVFNYNCKTNCYLVCGLCLLNSNNNH